MKYKIFNKMAGLIIIISFIFLFTGCASKPAVKPQPKEEKKEEVKPVEEIKPKYTEFTEIENLKPIYFDYRSAKIKDEYKSLLLEYAKWIKENSDLEIKLEGHCDDRGTDNYNLVLGKKRAESVKSYLVKSGIDRKRIITSSAGKSKPVCFETTESCRQKNRRVVFYVRTK